MYNIIVSIIHSVKAKEAFARARKHLDRADTIIKEISARRK